MEQRGVNTMIYSLTVWDLLVELLKVGELTLSFVALEFVFGAILIVSSYNFDVSFSGMIITYILDLPSIGHTIKNRSIWIFTLENTTDIIYLFLSLKSLTLCSQSGVILVSFDSFSRSLSIRDWFYHRWLGIGWDYQ